MQFFAVYKSSRLYKREYNTDTIEETLKRRELRVATGISIKFSSLLFQRLDVYLVQGVQPSLFQFLHDECLQRLVSRFIFFIDRRSSL